MTIRPISTLAGILTFFTVLTAELVKHERSYIPQRDLTLGGGLCVFGLGSAILHNAKKLFKKMDAHKEAPPIKHHRPESFLRASHELMSMEILFTLIIPWIFVKYFAKDELRHGLGFSTTHINGDTDHGDILNYLLVPHLFFFQAQIVGELILYVGHQTPKCIYDYTMAANLFRGLTLVTWIRRSLLILYQQSTGSPFWYMNPILWLAVVLLPVIAVALWLYSTFIFLPLIWYPVLWSEEEQRKHHPMRPWIGALS